MDVLEQTSSVFTKNELSLLIRLEHFPTHVTSKGAFFTRDININNTRWYISIELRKYCQTSDKHIKITPDSSDQPETLAAYIHGERHHRYNGIDKDYSFDVEAQFKFKQVATAKGSKFSHKICLNSSNKYAYGCGTPKLAKIEVAFTFAFFIKYNLCLESFELTKWIFG